MRRSSLPSFGAVNVQWNESKTNKTIHPLLSQYSSIKQGRRGEGRLFEGRHLLKILADRRGAYSKGRLFEGRC